MPQTAATDSVYEINGDHFFVRAGDPYPDGATLRAAEQPVTADLPGVPVEGAPATETPPAEEESERRRR